MLLCTTLHCTALHSAAMLSCTTDHSTLHYTAHYIVLHSTPHFPKLHTTQHCELLFDTFLLDCSTHHYIAPQHTACLLHVLGEGEAGRGVQKVPLVSQ